MIILLASLVYAMFALCAGRLAGRALYYEEDRRDWETLAMAAAVGLLAGIAWPLWLIPVTVGMGIKRLSHDDPDILARAFFGEPEPIRQHRQLEQKVGIHKKSKELETWMEQNS